jgi:uncharacterized protein YgbK (DUF1537 family)
MRILAIADDLTGAIEVGAMFAKEGVRSLVSLSVDVLPEAEAVVVDALTRHLAPSEAAARVARLANQAREAQVPYVYKKTDSTLRGNIAAEFQALLRAYPERPLAYAPAYPRMGRVVIEGELYIHGQRLPETPFARDPREPQAEGNIPKLLAQGCDAPVVRAPAGGPIARLLMQVPPGTVLLCDGASDEDLEAVAQALRASGRPCIVAGTAGFCEPWARALPLARVGPSGETAVTPCLVVNGSLHPASLEQVRRAAGEVPVVTLEDDSDRDAATTAAVLDALAVRGWAAFSTPGTCPEGAAARLGAITQAVLSSAPVDGLVVFGGDTARAVLDALGVAVVEPRRELLPGIPLSVVRLETRELPLVTKAGGFGDSETLLAIKAALREEA